MQNASPFALKKITLLFLLLCSLTGAFAQFGNPLFIPDTLAGPVYNLDLGEHKVAFIPGDSTDTYGINQPYLGPTLIMHDGDSITLNVTNNISDTTTMHWHGMHVAPEDDGGPHTMILPGETWSPTFKVRDQATTFWYHPHLHYKTATQVYKGAAGLIINRDSASAALNLPHTYGVDDFPVIIQDKTFDAGNQFIFAALNDTVMINGTLSPFLTVPAQLVRFRLLNGSNQRVYNVGLPPNLNAWQIGSDGGLLEAPLPLTVFRLAPGERIEIVIDFGQQTVGNALQMPCNNSQLGPGVSGGPSGPGGGPGNPLDGVDFNLMEFRITPPTPNAVFTLPQTLNTITPWDEADANRTRIKVFDTIPPNSFPYYINSTNFDMSFVNDTVWLDDIEVWELYNHTTVAHPFHIHDIQFYVLELNGMPPPPHLRGRKDVILSLPGDTIRFIAKFDDFWDLDTPYMYHCHNLFHEDAGMMGQFIVAAPGSIGFEEEMTDLSGRFTLFPNPASDRITLADLENNFRGIETIEIRSMQGGLLQQIPVRGAMNSLEIEVGDYAAGMYLIGLRGASGVAWLRMVRN